MARDRAVTVRKSSLTDAVVVDTAIWEDPDWVSLTSTAQLVGFAAMTLRSRGQITTTRIQKLSGWDTEFIASGMDELRESGYKWLLHSGKARRGLPARTREAVKKRDGYKCVYCGSSKRLEVDHIFPWTRGGTNALNNLQTLCFSCNRSKGAKF